MVIPCLLAKIFSDDTFTKNSQSVLFIINTMLAYRNRRTHAGEHSHE